MSCNEAQEDGEDGDSQTDAQGGDDLVRSVIVDVFQLILDLGWRRSVHGEACMVFKGRCKGRG